MITIGQKIVYRDEVCIVQDIAQDDTQAEQCYTLTSLHDSTLVIKVPVRLAADNVRPLITRSELSALVKKIPEIQTVPIDSWNRGTEYKDLLSEGSHESIVCIIKTAYERQHECAEKKHKSNESVKTYFRHAEKLFYNEIAAALDITYAEAKELVVKEVEALELQAR